MTGDVTTPAENKALIRRWFDEVWNQGREEMIDQLRAANAVATGLGEGNAKSEGSAAFKTFYSNLRSTLPDLSLTIEDILAEGDKVAVRISVEGTHLGDALGVAPTGRHISFNGMTIARIDGGKIVEAWNLIDQLSLLTQIGALPPNTGEDRFLTTRSPS